MNDQHFVLCHYHYQLKEVSGPVSASHEVPRRIITQFGPGEGLRVRVLDVGIGNLVPTCRPMDLHTK